MKKDYTQILHNHERMLARVVSFGLSIKGISPSQRRICDANLSKIGIDVSFGKHVESSNHFDTSSVSERIEDLHDALRDENVKIIFSTLGGMNVGQILESIDWNLLERNPKIFSGFSDMAVLTNAIFAKTGISTLYGPFYGTFGMEKGFDYSLHSFQSYLNSCEPKIVNQASFWSDDAWWIDQNNRIFNVNEGPLILNKGQAKGRLIGGHLTSLATLFGTEFFPSLKDSILMIEENSEVTPRSFDRLLQSILHQRGFDKVKALLIGRFTRATNITDEILKKIISNYPQLTSIPVVGNLSFGHTYPQFTFPIGSNARLTAGEDCFSFEIENQPINGLC